MATWVWLLLLLPAGISGCSSYQVIPEALKGRVNTDVSFEQLKEQPASMKGKLVVLGGEVLRATRLADRTRLEVLQTPLSSDLAPHQARTASQGRFLAYDQRGEDPAILREGTLVTIIGELQDPTTGRVGEIDYVYPTLAIRDMTVWDVQTTGGPVLGPLWGYPYGSRPYTFWSGARVAG